MGAGPRPRSKGLRQPEALRALGDGSFCLGDSSETWVFDGVRWVPLTPLPCSRASCSCGSRLPPSSLEVKGIDCFSEGPA